MLHHGTCIYYYMNMHYFCLEFGMLHVTINLCSNIRGRQISNVMAVGHKISFIPAIWNHIISCRSVLRLSQNMLKAKLLLSVNWISRYNNVLSWGQIKPWFGAIKFKEAILQILMALHLFGCTENYLNCGVLNIIGKIPCHAIFKTTTFLCSKWWEIAQQNLVRHPIP